MSNSRLEKFIYAICGMEVDDLPTPLSRIETLWNCLITGETPDFEPLSRNEKYLMSILTGDVDVLPEPTSRSEKLLYKIATGETDLTDVPGYLSRYEELLKHLIENGGIGGTDFEYVLYTLNDSFSTLYSTAEAPVKSAILSGQTLVNILETSTKKTLTNNHATLKFEQDVKPNTKYLVVAKFSNNTTTNTQTERVFMAQLVLADNVWVNKPANEVTGIVKQVITTKSSIGTQKSLAIGCSSLFGGSIDVEDVMMFEYQEGMENWDIPYFEGMQSVKMPVLKTTGKNLFDGELVKNKYYNSSVGELVVGNNNLASVNPIRVNPNTDIVLSTSAKLPNNSHYICEYASDGTFIKRTNSSKITTSETTYFIKFHFAYETINESPNVQLEEGSTATSYEPYKTNILSTSEDVVLRGIGDVQDTLDCLTGEVTERIGEVVLDGSGDWKIWYHTDNILRYMIKAPEMLNTTNLKVKSDKLPSYGYNINKEGIFGNNGSLIVILDNSDNKLNGNTVIDFKAWLSQNPIIVQYQLANEQNKTVGLSITDQNGQPTKLKTFNDITHVSIEAEDLLPTVDLEVPTKIEETLSTLPTLMNDISETQQSLNEKIDNQAENINEVSTAMAEIHNDIL